MHVRSFTEKTSKGEEQHQEEDITSDSCNEPLLSSSNNMKAVKTVLQNGTGRIAPTNSLDHSSNGSGGGNKSIKPTKAPFLAEERADIVPQDR